MCVSAAEKEAQYVFSGSPGSTGYPGLLIVLPSD